MRSYWWDWGAWYRDHNYLVSGKTPKSRWLKKWANRLVRDTRIRDARCLGVHDIYSMTSRLYAIDIAYLVKALEYAECFHKEQCLVHDH